MRKGQSTVRHNPEPMRMAMPAYAHSLHPHGFVFAATSSGAYPLSPPDLSQPIPAAEQAALDSRRRRDRKQARRPRATREHVHLHLGNVRLANDGRRLALSRPFHLVVDRDDAHQPR